MKKRTIKLALGALALGVASTAVTLEANAATWSDVLYQSASDSWVDGTIGGYLWTGQRRTYFSAHGTSGNYFTGGVYVNCNGQPLYGWGGQTYVGSTEHEYYCPGISTINNAQAWIHDL